MERGVQSAMTTGASPRPWSCAICWVIGLLYDHTAGVGIWDVVMCEWGGRRGERRGRRGEVSSGMGYGIAILLIFIMIFQCLRAVCG